MEKLFEKCCSFEIVEVFCQNLGHTHYYLFGFGGASGCLFLFGLLFAFFTGVGFAGVGGGPGVCRGCRRGTSWKESLNRSLDGGLCRGLSYGGHFGRHPFSMSLPTAASSCRLMCARADAAKLDYV